jgi:Xaa-Pro aminopeptidase
MRINIKSALIAATLAIGTLAATSIATTAPAQAKGFGFGFGHHFGHGWGHGWGGFGVYGGDDYEGGCFIKHYYDEDGYEHFRKVCY